MKYYPVFLDVKGRSCLVVGGGQVGARKAVGLAKAHARVRVVSLEFSAKLVETESICLVKKPFEVSDLEGISLVFAATDSKTLNSKIRKAAQTAGILCNVVDGKDKGDFILPSVVEQGDLLVAVSTCGASPAMARKLRKELEEMLGPEYGEALILLANIRKKMLAQGHDPQGHRQKLNALVEADLAGLIARGDMAEIDAVLAQTMGDDFTFDRLSAPRPNKEV
ncbi:MAG: bifunctional precorrin-2 dehydrogenase/sirohydrochlorin ferrochelatase [Desulfobacter sp.]|nr:MAG: bifunctional precorrin-2 dehydrogenase/sirohydrochlorin ferrochelatase [Desulfobacter sp.]